MLKMIYIITRCPKPHVPKRFESFVFREFWVAFMMTSPMNYFLFSVHIKSRNILRLYHIFKNFAWITVDSFILQSFTGFSANWCTRNNWNPRLGVRGKCFFLQYNRHLRWKAFSGSTIALYDSLFLNQMKRYDLEVCTQHRIWFLNYCIKV